MKIVALKMSCLKLLFEQKVSRFKMVFLLRVQEEFDIVSARLRPES